MNEREKTLENVRTRYFLSEAREDLNEALRREDYETAREYAEIMYGVLFKLCENQTGDEKKAEKSRLKELSDLIDSIDDKLNSGGKKNEPA